MPRVSVLSLLPEDIKFELHKRLFESGFGQVVELSKWLESQGVQISKSALSEYSIKNRAAIVDQFARQQERLAADTARRQDVRLRILEVCAARPGRADLISEAQELLDWVRRGDDGDAQTGA